jgi:raffinose/stachyose/melibiose transport system substrate-binding protein
MPVRTSRPVLAVVAVLASSLLLQACAAGDAGSDGQVEMTFLNQSRGQEAVLNELAEQYTAQTGIKITVDSPGPVDYLPKLQGKAQSNSMPDIYSSFDAVAMDGLLRRR